MNLTKSITFGDDRIGTEVLPDFSSAMGGEDSRFIENLKAGEQAAFELLVERHSSGIYSLLLRLTGDPDEASDLTQDTFLRAFRSIGGFRGDAGVKTWLYRIAVNESRNRFRWWKRRRRGSMLSLDAPIGESETSMSEIIPDNSVSPEDAALARERRWLIISALGNLKAVYREAVILCDIEGLSYEETAFALGIGVGTVKSRIFRGRDELRRQLKDF